MKSYLFIIIIAISLVINLGGDCNLTTRANTRCYDNSYTNITNYSFTEETKTTKGISIMRNGIDVSLDEIDRRTDELEACLMQHNAIDMPIKRSCLRVLFPTDWYVSECTGAQLFPCNMPTKVCTDKGITLEELERCPCNCRAIIQDENMIVTAPNMELYKAELARMVTGLNNVWVTDWTECLVD